VIPAYQSLPEVPKSGVAKVAITMAPNGTAVHSIQGRNFPQRVDVRSAMAPITGVKTAPPMMPAQKMIIDAHPASMP